MKSRYLEYGGKLTLVCAVCMVGVAGAYVLARERIERGKAQSVTTAIREVLGLRPGDPDPRPLLEGVADAEQVYLAEVGGERRYAGRGEWQGFSSKVQVAVGARATREGLRIIEVRVISQKETPGLGTRIEDQETNLTFWSKIGSLLGAKIREEKDWWFLKRYRGKGIENLVLTGDPGEADRRILKMTGATITSNATTRAVRAALDRIREVLK